MNIINKLKNKSSFGHDTISNKLIKRCKDILVKPITLMINQTLKTGIFPCDVKLSRIKPLFAANGYKLFHVPRPCRRGGGVAILIKEGISVIKPDHSPRRSFEYMELLVTAISIHIRVVVIYRPPTSKLNKMTKLEFVNEFIDFLEILSALSGRLLICGDFNINWLDKKEIIHNIGNVLITSLAMNI